MIPNRYKYHSARDVDAYFIRRKSFLFVKEPKTENSLRTIGAGIAIIYMMYLPTATLVVSNNHSRNRSRRTLVSNFNAHFHRIGFRL
jgi:hypothetical protein